MARLSALLVVLLAVLAGAPVAHAGHGHPVAVAASQPTPTVPSDLPSKLIPKIPNGAILPEGVVPKSTTGRSGRAKGSGASPTATPGVPPTATTIAPPSATTGVPPGAATAVPGAAASPPSGQAPQPAPAPKAAPSVADGAVGAAARVDSSDAGVPGPLVALAILAGLMLLAAALYGLARWWAWEPRWIVRARHAGGEAGWRASSSWAEFRDWVRLGR